MYEAIVVLPLLGAIIAGAIALFGARNRFPGENPPPPHDDHAAPPVAEDHPHAAPSPDAPHAASSDTPWRGASEGTSRPPPGSLAAELITSTFLVISCVLSWFAFFDVGFGGPRRARHAVLVHHLRRPAFGMGAAHRFADRRDAGRGDDRLVARPHLFDRLHGGGSVQAALLLLSVVLHLRHADAGDGRQSRAAVLRLGRRRARELSADRLLVPQAGSQCRGDQGLHRQPRRRFRLLARHFCRLLSHRRDRLRHDLRAGAGAGRQELSFPQLGRRRADRDLPVAVHGRDGQVGAVPAAHLAARRDGGPDAGLGADPRRDHGDRGRVHGGAAVAAVLAGAGRRRPS